MCLPFELKSTTGIAPELGRITHPMKWRIPGSVRTRQPLSDLIEGEMLTPDERGKLVQLAVRLSWNRLLRPKTATRSGAATAPVLYCLSGSARVRTNAGFGFRKHSEPRCLGAAEAETDASGSPNVARLQQHTSIVRERSPIHLPVARRGVLQR